MQKFKFIPGFLFVFLLLSFNTFSQEVNYLRGPEFTSQNGVFKTIIGEDKSAFYALRMGTKGSGIQNNVEKYNKKTFQMEWVKDVSFDSDLGDKLPGSKLLTTYEILSKGKIYVILTFAYTRKNTRSAYMKVIDAANGQQQGTAKLLVHEEKYGGTDGFRVSFSKDSTLVLIKSRYDNLTSHNRYGKVNLFELASGQEIFSKDMPTEDVNGSLDVTSVNTDNDGNLLCVYTHTGTQKEGSPPLLPGIGKIPANSNKMISFDLNIGVSDHAYLTSNDLLYDKNFNYAFVTGMFIDVPCKSKRDCERKEGVFFMKIDLNRSKILTKQAYYFDDKLHDYYKNLFDNMGNYERLGCVTSTIDKKTEDVYSFFMGLRETMMVARFTKEGKLIWCKPLPRGKGLIDLAHGFSYSIHNKKLYLIYTDDPHNMELDANNFEVKKVKLKSSITGANVVSVTIDDSGNIQQKILSVNEKTTANFNPEDIDNLAESAPIYNLKNRDKEQFVRFEVPK